MKRLVGAFLVIILSVNFFLPAGVAATSYGGIGGAPAYSNPLNPRSQSIFIFQLKFGQTATNAIKIGNDTNQSQTVTLDSVDSELASDGQFTCKQAVEPKTDVGAWVSLSSTPVSLKPYSTKIVPFTITVPNSNKISVGEHDGCITLQAASQTATSSNKNGIVLSFRSAIRVVVTIPGKLVKKLSIKSLTVSPSKNAQYQLTPTIKNEGNVSLDAALQLQLVSVLGGRTAVSVNEGSLPVMPNSQISAAYNVSRPFWGGFYVARAVVKYSSNPSVELGLQTKSNQTRLSMNSKILFVTPQPIAALIEAVVIIAIIWLIFWLVRRHKHHLSIRHNWQTYTIKHGDSIGQLAKSNKMSWKKIATANKMKPPYTLIEGETIKLPPHSKE